MKKLLLYSAVIAFAAYIAFNKGGISFNRIEDLSVSGVVSDAKRHDGEKIWLTGYTKLTGEFEGLFLVWNNKGDAALNQLAPSVRIHRFAGPEVINKVKMPYEGYVKLKGTFRIVPTDPLYHLYLELIEDIEYPNISEQK